MRGLSPAMMFLLLPAFAFTLYTVSIRQVEATYCPLAIDLNGNGRIDVGGISTTSAQVYSMLTLPRFVEFDLLAIGEPQRIDWIQPGTDGFLLDLRRGVPPEDLDGSWLFANDTGFNGFEKLQEFDLDGNGSVEGDELKAIGIWMDDGDARLQPNELRSLEEYDLASLSTLAETTPGKYGGDRLTSSAQTSEGTSIYVEDVWFLSETDVNPRDLWVAGLYRR